MSQKYSRFKVVLIQALNIPRNRDFIGSYQVLTKFSELLRDMNVVTCNGMVLRGNMTTTGAVLLGNNVPEVML